MCIIYLRDISCKEIYYTKPLFKIKVIREKRHKQNTGRILTLQQGVYDHKGGKQPKDILQGNLLYQAIIQAYNDYVSH